MPNITVTNPMSIEKELDNLSLYKHHPNGILRASLNRLQDMLDGKVEISDPSNPFTYLLETSCLNTAFAIQEYALLTRKTYPKLANSEADLYLHMSDVDYVDRFATPATAKVNFNILLSDFKSKAHYDNVLGERVLKIPRHFKLEVDNYVFTLQSAILIRLTDNGIIDIKYENQTFNSLFPVKTNYIDFNIYTVNQNESYISFQAEMQEVDIEQVEVPVEKSKLFKNTLSFNPNRKFYYLRAFYLRNGEWNEMLTTHTEQVYDIDTPTCIVKVSQDKNEVEYNIPPVYVNSNRIGTKVKFLIYTTMGSVVARYSDYKIGDFSSSYGGVFPSQELDVTTEALNIITKVVYIEEEVVDGKDQKPFAELKKSVLDNIVGDRKLPITNRQLETSVTGYGFNLIKDIDVVTNRIFLLECPIPSPPTRYPVSKINMDLIEYKSTVDSLLTGKNKITSPPGTNNEVVVLPEGTVFELRDNELYLLDTLEESVLSSLSDLALSGEVNSKKYLSLYYHYVLNTQFGRTELRAYDISSPSVLRTNFKEFNQTCRVGINTASTSMIKTSSGFSMYVASSFKKYDDAIEAEQNVKPYIVYKDEGGGYFFLESNLYTVIDGSPVYLFKFDSSFYIDSDNKLEVTNFKDFSGNTISVRLDLLYKAELIYVSDVIPSSFVSTDTDTRIYGSYLAGGNCVVTLEEMDIGFGKWLDRLYSRVRSSVNILPEQRYQNNVPLLHTKTVYDTDNSVLHYPGDPVLDEDSNPVYEHEEGDVIEPGDASTEVSKYLNLLFIDYKATIANTDLDKKYRTFLKTYLTGKITEEATDVQNLLLENTQGFVVVPKVIDKVRVKVKGTERNIDGSQSFKVNVYVNRNVFEDVSVRDSIEYTVVKEIDDYLYKSTKLNKTELLTNLYSKLKEFVVTMQIEKFTEIDEEYIEMVDYNTRISLNKVITAVTGGYEIKEDVVINFNMVK